MEHLTYSIWFTLMWWLIIFSSLVEVNQKNSEDRKPEATNLEMAYGAMIFIPAIAILLEYLIVR